MSLAAMLAKSKQMAVVAPTAPVAATVPATIALAIPAEVSAAPLSNNEAQLVGHFRKAMQHLRSALADPKYAISVEDAVRDIGMTIREHPHLNTLIEPQDFASLVTVITESAAYKARNAAETKNTRAVKSAAKDELAAAFDNAFSAGLADTALEIKSTPSAMTMAPKKVNNPNSPNLLPPQQQAGINIAALLARKKG